MAYPPRITFVDFETGGFSPSQHTIIDMAAIRAELHADKSSIIVTDSLSVKVLPETPVDPEAARINGYTEEEWAKQAIPLAEALRLLTPMITQWTLFATWNVVFDHQFLIAGYRRCGMVVPSYIQPMDLMALTEPLRARKIVSKRNLRETSTLLGFLGSPDEQTHRAWGDCQLNLWCYAKLLGFKWIYDRRTSKSADTSVLPPDGTFDRSLQKGVDRPVVNQKPWIDACMNLPVTPGT